MGEHFPNLTRITHTELRTKLVPGPLQRCDVGVLNGALPRATLINDCSWARRFCSAELPSFCQNSGCGSDKAADCLQNTGVPGLGLILTLVPKAPRAWFSCLCYRLEFLERKSWVCVHMCQCYCDSPQPESNNCRVIVLILIEFSMESIPECHLVSFHRMPLSITKSDLVKGQRVAKVNCVQSADCVTDHL